MKRFLKATISTLLILSLVFSLVACGNNEDDKVTVESIKIVEGTYPTSLEVGETPDLSALKIEVKYSDGTTKEIGYAELTVSAIDTSKDSVQKLEVTFEGVTVSVNITVGNPNADTYIYDIKLPQNLVSRDSYKKNFNDATLPYYVGDDNPYIFYVDVIMLDSEDNLVDVDGKTVATETKVFLVNEDGTEKELTGTELTAMVVKDEANNTYDFTDAAVGKTFRLEVKPEGYEDDAKSHVIQVVDGYNVYSAKELNLLTNTTDDIDGSFGEGDLDQLAAVNRFLEANGITRPKKLTGMILHENVNITTKDIPSEYLYSYKDSNGNDKVGVYDNFYLFYHINRPDSETESSTLSIYGNYYSIFSYDLPNVVPNGVANNDDAFSNGSLFRFSAASLDDTFLEGYDHKDFSTNIIGVAFRDNNPNSDDQTNIDRHMLGLTCMFTSFQVSNITNTNIEAFTISLLTYHDDQTINLNKVKFYNAWQGHLFVWNNNCVDEEISGDSASPRAEYQNIKINITDSTLAKCGGPVILSQNVDTSSSYNSKSGADIVVDDKSVLYSYVTGQEAWFVGVGQTSMVMQILALDTTIEASLPDGVNASFVSNEKIPGSDTVNMIYVNMGIGTGPTPGMIYRGSFTRAGETHHDAVNNPMVSMYLGATGGEAPVFQTSAGGTAFSDGASGCYGIESGAPGAPTDNFFEGDYISLYYMGFGILFEYYH